MIDLIVAFTNIYSIFCSKSKFTGTFNIQNSKNGQYLSVVDDELVMTKENLGIQSEWSWRVNNEFYGYIVPVSLPEYVLDAPPPNCGPGTTPYWATTASKGTS